MICVINVANAFQRQWNGVQPAAKKFVMSVRRHVLFVVKKSVLLRIVRINPYAQCATNAVGVWHSSNVELIIVTACSVKNAREHHVLIAIELAAQIVVALVFVRAESAILFTARSVQKHTTNYSVRLLHFSTVVATVATDFVQAAFHLSTITLIQSVLCVAQPFGNWLGQT